MVALLLHWHEPLTGDQWERLSIFRRRGAFQAAPEN